MPLDAEVVAPLIRSANFKTKSEEQAVLTYRNIRDGVRTCRASWRGSGLRRGGAIVDAGQGGANEARAGF